MAERELSLNLSDEARDLLVEKGWDPAMGARPLRRAIQRYIEDPLADEVLRQGDIVAGTTVLVERDPSGDEEERPVKMKLVKPKKRPAKKREPVGVGAKSGNGEGGTGPDHPHNGADADDDGDRDEPAPEPPAEEQPQPE
jgi:ATP-dependent Clp protease ATP-binding subunit ClpC